MVWEPRNSVAGTDAPNFKVIRVDSMGDAHTGALVEADATTGTFSWKDHVNGELRHASLGPHSIKIVQRM